MSKLVLPLKQEINNSFSKSLVPEDKAKIENSSAFVKIKGNLFSLYFFRFNLNEKTNFADQLKELRDHKWENITNDKINEFSQQFKKIILNSPEIFQMLCNFKLFDSLNQPITFEVIEENEVTKKIEQSINLDSEKENTTNEYCEEELNNMDNENAQDSTLANNEIYQSSDIDTEAEDTKEAKNDIKSEHNENERMNDLRYSNDEFLKFFCFNNVNTIIYDMESIDVVKQLNNMLNKVWIPPIFTNNYLFFPLPKYTNSMNSFSFSCINKIFVDIVLLLNYHYFYITKGKILKNEDYRQINDKCQEKINKIENLKSYLLKYHPKNIDTFFFDNNIDYIVVKASKSYFNKYPYLSKQKEKKRLYIFFHKIFNELRDNLKRYSNNKEKIQKLFDIITYYNIETILKSRHFIYSSFLNYILDYTKNQLSLNLSLKIENFYKIILYTKAIWYNKIRNFYIKVTEDFLCYVLKNDYYFNIISYGSSSTDLDIIGSDKDYIIFNVEKIKLNEDFLSRLNKRLSEQNIFNLDIKFIPNASVPVIKLTYDLSKGIYINKEFEMYNFINIIRQYKFFDNYDCTKIKIDISSTKDHKTIENTKKMTELIITELKNYPLIRPVVLYLKFYLKKYNMNSVYLGWLSSLAIFLMIRNIVKTYIKENHKNDLSIWNILYLFLKKFSNYNYDYIIDKDGYDIPYVQSNDDKRFIIINPLDPNKNVCESSFQTKKIKECFANMLKYIIATGEIPF